nr:uncharacterized protein LOC123574173 [Macaca fascicularis]
MDGSRASRARIQMRRRVLRCTNATSGGRWFPGARRRRPLQLRARAGAEPALITLCSDCEIHTIAPFSLKGGRRGAAAARPAISCAHRGRVHSGDKGGAAGPGLLGSRVSHPTGCSPLLPRHFPASFVGSQSDFHQWGVSMIVKKAWTETRF